MNSWNEARRTIGSASCPSSTLSRAAHMTSTGRRAISSPSASHSGSSFLRSAMYCAAKGWSMALLLLGDWTAM